MLFSFLHKQQNLQNQKEITKKIIQALRISPEQKTLYIEALQVTSEEDLKKLYKNIENFVETVELKNLESLQKNTKYQVKGMKKREAQEHIEEMNNASFLIHNL